MFTSDHLRKSTQVTLLKLVHSALCPTTTPSFAMPTVAAGIDFDHVAREWRMKYTEDGDKASATAAMAGE